MIQGEVLQELIPSRRYKVRIMNNKPLKDDIKKTLEEEAAKVQEALDEIQKKYDDYNGDNKILALEIDIERLEQHEEQTLSVLNKINKLERQIYNITVIKSEIERTFRSVAQELRNVQVQLIRLNNEPDYFDFEMWCSNYRKWNVGDTVPVVSNGYDVKDWVILPDWEFNKDSAGFGNALTSKYLLETYEWVYSQIKLNENVNKDVTKYGKAKVIYREGDKVSIQVEWARIWDMGTVSRQRIQEVYTNCNTIYTEGSYIPYFIGSEVLVRFRSDWEADVIGFWQEPVKPFSVSVGYSYKKKLFIQGLPDRDDDILKASKDWGYKVNTSGRSVIFPVTRTYPNIQIKSPNNSDYKTIFVGMADNYPEADILHNTSNIGKMFNFFNKHNRSYNSAIIPNSLYIPSSPSSIGDTNVLNNGVRFGSYIRTSAGSNFYPQIRFHTNQIMWNNCIMEVDDNYIAKIRSGVVYTPPSYNLISLVREDESRAVKPFNDPEIQYYISQMLNNRDLIYQNNIENMAPLLNPRSGLTFNNYHDFFYDCLSSSGFFSQTIVDSIIIDQVLPLDKILGNFVLNNINNLGNYANTTYISGNNTWILVDGSVKFGAPVLNVVDNNEATDLFSDYKKAKHSDVIEDGIIKNGQAFNQFEDWYVRNVSKTDTFTDSQIYKLSDYEKNLYFEYYKINYIE